MTDRDEDDERDDDRDVEQLRADLIVALGKRSKLEDDLMLVERTFGAVANGIRTVQAIMHLRRFYPQALGSNVEPNIEIALMECLKTISECETKIDRIPF